MSEVINPPELPPPTGFAHGIKTGNTLYIAGQVGDGDTLVEQFSGALGRVKSVIEAAGGTASDLVSLQVFTTDVPAYKQALKPLGQAWRDRFGRHYPAMGLFGVTELFDPAYKVELMGIAVIER